jgi:hypothetical protein
MPTVGSRSTGCLLAMGLVSFEARNPGVLDIEKYAWSKESMGDIGLR